jgi:hypothetical protein
MKPLRTRFGIGPVIGITHIFKLPRPYALRQIKEENRTLFYASVYDAPSGCLVIEKRG